MISERRVRAIRERYESLQQGLAKPGALQREEYARVSKELAEMAPLIAEIDTLSKLNRELGELAEIVDDPESEEEMRELAAGEIKDRRGELSELEDRLHRLLIPKDEADEKNAILEIRPGTGGDEAALFAADLFRMYEKYTELHGWKFEVLHAATTDLGGFKEGVSSISGRGAFARLKYESGVHRVQRVPETEASGRIHTSAATVAVLPEAEEVDVKIDDKDLRIDVFRSSGPGGQSVNTTDSAVRITHIPTGIVVSQQDEKSQHKNRAKAMRVLRARLYEREREERDVERAQTRRSQVGSGDRSERVRTYNFPQGRVTDHRINLTLHKLDRILAGDALDEIIDRLIAEDQAQRLAAECLRLLPTGSPARRHPSHRPSARP